MGIKMAVAFANIFMAYLLIDISSTPNISFSPSSLHLRLDFSLLPTFPDHFSLLPILLFSVQLLTYKRWKGGYGSALTPTRVAT